MIRVDDLAFAYPGAPAPAIRGLTFEVGDGEVFGFLGPSGAGKTTTQNILIGLLRGWTGTIEVGGRSLTDWGMDYYRHVGVSFELPNHYLKLTARENLAYFCTLYGLPPNRAPEVMERVGLGGDVDKPVGAFSKGMKNRLNFARALLHRPRVLFLDEPTSGLDPVNAIHIREIVGGLRDEGVTTFLTTHNMTDAEQLCDRVAFLMDGGIAALDSPTALRRAHGRREVVATWTRDDATHTARFDLDGLADAAEFQRILREERLDSLHSQETTLEDVFAKVTGRSLT